MRPHILACQLVLSAMLAPLPALMAPARADTPRADTPRADVASGELVAGLLSEVVNIAITTYDSSGGATGNMVGQTRTTMRRTLGSGFIVDPSGLIATNRHVVAKSHDIVVILHDGTRLKATLVAAAAQADMALLKVDAGRPLPSVTFGDSDAMVPGDAVYVIGNPLGLSSTVTAGIVSALDRNTVESEAVSFLQIDAALNTGNSGGAVFNTRGQVIGVSTALFSPEGGAGSVGLGFAIPGNDAKFILRRLATPEGLHLGWIGAHVQRTTPDVAAAVGLPAGMPLGCIITAVDPGSPAAQAGLREGDLVLDIGGEVTAEPRLLNRIVASSPVGGDIALTVWRADGKAQLNLKVMESAADIAAAKTGGFGATAAPSRLDRPDLGLLLGPADADTRARLGLPPRQVGVLVTNVVPNSEAAQRDVLPGSLILNFERSPVTAPEQIQPRIDAARAAKHDSVLLLVADQQGRHWVSLSLN